MDRAEIGKEVQGQKDEENMLLNWHSLDDTLPPGGVQPRKKILFSFFFPQQMEFKVDVVYMRVILQGIQRPAFLQLVFSPQQFELQRAVLVVNVAVCGMLLYIYLTCPCICF